MRALVHVTMALAALVTSATPRVIFQRAGGAPGPRTVQLPDPTTPPPATTTTTTSEKPMPASPSYPVKAANVPKFTVDPDPTLEPGRLANYVPVPSAAETSMYRYGPTAEPDRGSGMYHGCTWQPAFFGCDCIEVMEGCQEATLACEVALQKEEMAAPDAARRHYMATFDRVELNAVQKRSLRSKGKPPGFPIDGYPWGKSDFTTKLQKLGVDATMPSEFGHLLFEDPPDWDSVMRGKCTLEEMEGAQSCLSYFRGCHSNFVNLKEWRETAEDNTAETLASRLGGFGGSASWEGASGGT